MEWRDIPGWEGRYQASSAGEIRSLRAGKQRVLKGGIGSKYGHRKVVLGKHQKTHWVHRLILLTFVGKPPPGHIARHLDGDSSNNALSNLKWGTPAENNADMVRHGTSTRGRTSTAKLDGEQAREIRSLRRTTPAAEVAERFGVSKSTVYQIWCGARWGWVDA